MKCKRPFPSHWFFTIPAKQKVAPIKDAKIIAANGCQQKMPTVRN